MKAVIVSLEVALSRAAPFPHHTKHALFIRERKADVVQARRVHDENEVGV